VTSAYTTTRVELTEQAAPNEAVGSYPAAELGDKSWQDCSVELISGGGVRPHVLRLIRGRRRRAATPAVV
jgi:hypothetical protein